MSYLILYLAGKSVDFFRKRQLLCRFFNFPLPQPLWECGGVPPLFLHPHPKSLTSYLLLPRDATDAYKNASEMRL